MFLWEFFQDWQSTDKCKTVLYQQVRKDGAGPPYLRANRASEQRFWAEMCLEDVSPRAIQECKTQKGNIKPCKFSYICCTEFLCSQLLCKVFMALLYLLICFISTLDK